MLKYNCSCFCISFDCIFIVEIMLYYLTSSNPVQFMANFHLTLLFKIISAVLWTWEWTFSVSTVWFPIITLFSWIGFLYQGTHLWGVCKPSCAHSSLKAEALEARCHHALQRVLLETWISERSWSKASFVASHKLCADWLSVYHLSSLAI